MFHFWKKRGVSEEVNQEMKTERIDIEVVKNLPQENDELARFLFIGDRFALWEYCSKTEEPHQESSRQMRKRKCYASIREKMRFNVKDPSDRNTGESDEEHGNEKVTSSKALKLIGNKNAAKKTRAIEFGWYHNGMNVRRPNGGGTRRITVRKNSASDDLLKEGKKLFFPNNVSMKGLRVDQCKLSVRDFTHEPLQESTTVEDETCWSPVSDTEIKFGKGEGCSEVELSETIPLHDYSLQNPCGAIEVAIPSVPLQSLGHMHTVSPISTGSLTPPCPESQIHPIQLFDDDSFYWGCSNEYAPQPSTVSTLPTGSPIPPCDTQTAPTSPTPPGSVSQSQASANPTGLQQSPVQIKVRRSMFQTDMIASFMDPVFFTFVNEKGVDERGVSRDAYTSFWDQFMSSSSTGEQERVPTIMPHLQKADWLSIGGIVVKGFLNHGVFPIRISKTFFVAMIYGEHAVTPSLLMESFLQYVAKPERLVIQKAIDGILDDEDDQEEFVDMLARMDCHGVLELYEIKRPTCRKVLKLKHPTPNDSEENSVLGYLKQLIRGFSDEMLIQILHFVTGARVLCVENISISFNKVRGLARAPVARTCGPVLELPSTYSSFPEFKHEFLNILSGHSGKFDIC